MTAKRFDWDLNGIWDFQSDSDEYLESSKEICELLNEQHEQIQRLKQNIDELMCVNVEEELLKENEQLKKDLIDHSALISMLEDYQALKIEETLWNLTDAKSEEEFNELYEPYLEKAKRCWR